MCSLEMEFHAIRNSLQVILYAIETDNKEVAIKAVRMADQLLTVVQLVEGAKAGTA